MSERTRAHTPSILDELAKHATITVEEAAAVLGIGRSAAYEAVRRGDLPSRRLGRRIVFPVPALLTWLGVPEASSTVEG
jgi:excisionase family DNA binding protein